MQTQSTLQSDTLNYDYSYEPASNGDPRTLILFHGTGGDDASFMGLGRIVAPQVARISVRGDVNEFGNLRFFKRKGEGVYDMDDLAMRTHRLIDFLPDVLARHGRATETAIGLGYSNGANILSEILFNKPNVLGGAVIMHPLIPYEPEIKPGLSGKPVLLTTGRIDPISPPDHLQTVAGYFDGAGAATMHHVHEGGHEVRDSEVDAVRNWIAGFTA